MGFTACGFSVKQTKARHQLVAVLAKLELALHATTKSLLGPNRYALIWFSTIVRILVPLGAEHPIWAASSRISIR
jgi:hypothetical protein